MAGDLWQQFKYCEGSVFASVVYMVLQQLPQQEQLISEKKHVCIVQNAFFIKYITLSVVKDIKEDGKPEGKKLMLGLEDCVLFAQSLLCCIRQYFFVVVSLY